MSDRKKMNIAAIQYSLDNLALEVYVAGCNPPHCPRCHNEELWDFENGATFEHWEPVLRTYASAYSGEINMVKNVWVLGGEPLDQDHGQLTELAQFLRSIFRGCRMWLFTRREYNEVPITVRNQFHYIKTGPYKYELPPKSVDIDGNKLTLGSNNQMVHEALVMSNND